MTDAGRAPTRPQGRQTLGKKALGLYTIRAETGEFMGGAVGIGRKLLTW
jgi:hypothetical protein